MLQRDNYARTSGLSRQVLRECQIPNQQLVRTLLPLIVIVALRPAGDSGSAGLLRVLVIRLLHWWRRLFCLRLLPRAANRHERPCQDVRLFGTCNRNWTYKGPATVIAETSALARPINSLAAHRTADRVGQGGVGGVVGRWRSMCCSRGNARKRETRSLLAHRSALEAAGLVVFAAHRAGFVGRGAVLAERTEIVAARISVSGIADALMQHWLCRARGSQH